MKSLNLDNYTNQELKEMIDKGVINLDEIDSDKLADLMNFEIDMICFGEGDTDFISRCAEILEQREGNQADKTDVMEIIQRTESENVIITKKHPLFTRKSRIVLKRVALAAVLVSILVCSSACMAVLGFDICRYIADIVRQPAQTQFSVDGFTFHCNDKVKKYDSIEELVKQENLDIMYPTKLPEGVKITNVRISKEINGNDVVQILTNDINVGINIELKHNLIESSVDEIIVVDGKDFFIYKSDIFFANCFYNNNYYTITANTKEDLMIVLENFKEQKNDEKNN